MNLRIRFFTGQFICESISCISTFTLSWEIKIYRMYKFYDIFQKIHQLEKLGKKKIKRKRMHFNKTKSNLFTSEEILFCNPC